MFCKQRRHFSADLLLCFTSGTGNTDCKVETKSLDGETNLKLRSAHKKFAEKSMIKVVEEKKNKGFNACVRPSSVDMYRFSNNKYCEAKVMFDDPRDSMASTSIDTFSGSITFGNFTPKNAEKRKQNNGESLMENADNTEQAAKSTFPFNKNNVVLRGCTYPKRVTF